MDSFRLKLVKSYYVMRLRLLLRFETVSIWTFTADCTGQL